MEGQYIGPVYRASINTVPVPRPAPQPTWQSAYPGSYTATYYREEPGYWEDAYWEWW